MKKGVKIALKASAVALAVVLAVGGSAAGYFSYARKADLKITIDKTETKNVFDGFGASACWWAQYCGNSDNEDEVAKLLFSPEGLGLNIFRYNVGGGEAQNPDSKIDNPWRRSESFYVKNEATGEFEYDFTRDANAQEFLKTALSYGTVDTVVLFANSPHYSMTVSGRASGGDEKKQSNLPRENYEAYADYFLDITEYFIEKGVPVKYISPVNEPQWDWGGDWVGQEGCHYEEDELYELYTVFAREIKKRKLPVQLSCPESGQMGKDTNRWFKNLYENEEIKDVLGTLSYHSYWTDDYINRKASFGKFLDKNMSDAKVEMSEWCHLPCTAPTDSIDGALLEARVMANDLEYTGADSWSAWVGVNQFDVRDDGKNYSDGLLSANDDFSEYEISKRYYAVAHFSKFIPAGSVRLTTDKNVFDLKFDGTKQRFITNCVSFLTPDNKTVCVVVNEGDERQLTFNVDAQKMTAYTTTSDNNLAETYSGEVKQLTLPAKSIMTVVFE